MSQVSTYPFSRYKPIIWPLIRTLEGNMAMDALMTSRPMMPRYRYVRVPNFNWYKSHLLKIYEPVKDPFYRDPNLQKI